MEILILIALFLVIFLVFCYYENNKIDITKYNIDSESAKESFKIVHLSDFHSKSFCKVIYFTKKEAPDLICITGDYIDDKYRKAEKMFEYAKQLVEIAPVIYITGNHERRLDNFDEVMNILKSCGFKVLLNEDVDTKWCKVLGLDENQASFEDYKARRNGTFVYKDMSSYFNCFNDYNGFKLVLCHFPENFMGIKELNYSQYDFDLQLSGHAHGGQWIFPILGPLFSPGQGVLPKYARGTFGHKPKLIISRGLGNSEFPLRLFNHPEIVVVNVNKL